MEIYISIQIENHKRLQFPSPIRKDNNIVFELKRIVFLKIEESVSCTQTKFQKISLVSIPEGLCEVTFHVP